MGTMNPNSPPVEPTDEMLVAQVQQQHVDAFTLLYDRYAPTVYALAAHLLDPTVAEEIVQESFLRLWHRAEQFDPALGPFKPWFMTIARHHIWDVAKTRNREAKMTAIEAIDQLLMNSADPTVDVAETVWSQEEQTMMLQGLQQLPEEQRRVILLAYFGGLSHTSIAAELGWPLGTVKKRIRLALQKLHAHLLLLRLPTE